MKVFTELVSIILIFQQVSIFEAQSIDRCTLISTIVASTTPEARDEVLSELDNVFPVILPGVDISYSSLAEEFGIKVDEKGSDSFESALNEVSISRAKACGGDDIPASISPSDSARIIEEFQTAYSSDEKDFHNLRHLFGQLLCIDSQLNSPTRLVKEDLDPDACPPRDLCFCPPGGIFSTLTCPCEFFTCLDPENDLKPILGFSTHEECLAFVIDTTGSMSAEINQAREVIHEFLRSEEEIGDYGCYVLVPFGDIGPNHLDVSEESTGPVTVADTHYVGDLLSFYSATNALTPLGGGDFPEYCLSGIQKALRTRQPREDLDTMTPGSQIVVITDALSKLPEIKEAIISEANSRQVCIHFFLSSNPSSDGIYRNIADETHGTFIELFADWHLNKFINAYEPCDYMSSDLVKRQERAIIYSLDTRHTFQVTRFAILLKLNIDASAGTTVTITRPDHSQINVTTDAEDFAVYIKKHPQPGNWHAITEGAGFSVSVALTLEIDTTIVHLDHNKASTISPIACSDGRIVVLTSQANNMEDVRLNLVDEFHQIQHSIPLSKCSGAFVSDLIYFPSGSFTYHLAGKDSDGIDFNYDTKNKVTSTAAAASYSLTSIGSSVADINDVSTVLSFNLTNQNNFGSRFNFFVSTASGIRTQLTFNTSVIGARESFVVDVDVRITSSISDGTHDLTLTATNGCDTLTATRSVKECDCLNGGTCKTTTRRGNTITRCVCPPGYGGTKCQIEY